jgi:spoIIIJ-associated protein
MKTRRFFAGNTLPQALMAAARYHGLAPDELAYRVYDKRHGFVNRIRRFIVEVDPGAPLRTQRTGPVSHVPLPALPLAVPPTTQAAAAPRPAAPVVGAPVARSAAAPPARPARPPHPLPPPAAARVPGPSNVEPFLPPDEESELAAAVAVGRLLVLAGLELNVKVERQADRLVLSLDGPDEGLLRDLGEEFLDDLEQLTPRAIRGLAGRMVRCKVEGAGLRSAREEELRSLAERAAEEAVASGEAVLLEPLSSADRRIVHLALVDDPRVTTQSQGFGAEKRIQVSPAATSNPG